MVFCQMDGNNSVLYSLCPHQERYTNSIQFPNYAYSIVEIILIVRSLFVVCDQAH